MTERHTTIFQEEEGGASQPEQWQLSRGYTESYMAFPPMPSLGRGLRCPVLLIHGEADIHVPHADHAQRLLATLQQQHPQPDWHGGDDVLLPSVQLESIKGGNHFLTSSKAMKSSLGCIEAFVTLACRRAADADNM